MIDINNIKIVIWDLDDTFWRGTLSEGAVEVIDENVDLVKRLTDCGIINSICSKNDFEPSWEMIKSIRGNLHELFVLPSIDWTPKGIRICNQLHELGLRPENCLFIDDNIHNIEDARFACPSIITASPNEIGELIKQAYSIIPKDIEHKRLGQYKILEKKREAAEKFGDNIKFLFSSNIRVIINYDCDSKIDRIAELVTRANQLNFTKRRDTKEELLKLIEDKECKTGYVTVKDNFGDYGLVGFFAVKDNRFIHFLFSCRTIGQGIEEYVYAQLNYPELNIVQPVINQLENRRCPEWINQDIEDNHKEKQQFGKKVVFKGACDLSQMCEYLSSNSIVEEFSFISKERKIFIEHHNHSLNYLNWRNLNQHCKNSLIDDLVFNDSEMFKTSMYDDGVEMVILSTMIEPHMGIYCNKKNGFKIAFGEAAHPLTEKSEWNLYKNSVLPQGSRYFTDEWFDKFVHEYEFCGSLTVDEIISNVYKTLDILRPDVKICYVLGPEMRYEKESNPSYFGREKVYAEVNNRLRELSKINPRVLLIDVNKWIHSQSDFTNNINHWQRRIYYKMAEEVNSYLSDMSSIDVKKKGYLFIVKKNVVYHLAKYGLFESKLWKGLSKVRISWK